MYLYICTYMFVYVYIYVCISIYLSLTTAVIKGNKLMNEFCLNMTLKIVQSMKF